MSLLLAKVLPAIKMETVAVPAMFTSRTDHLTSQDANSKHVPGPFFFFFWCLFKMLCNLLRLSVQHSSGSLKLGTGFWGHSSTYTNSMSGWEAEGKQKWFCKGNTATLHGWLQAHPIKQSITDLPVRCNSSQSPWPPPPCPPSWGVSPFIWRFSPPEYMFFLGKKARQTEAHCIAWQLHPT